MKYHAILTGVPDLERPVQSFSNALPPLLRWADLTLDRYVAAGHKDALVTIYETTRQMVWQGNKDNRAAVPKPFAEVV